MGGMTSAAAMSVTPRTFMLAKIANVRSSISNASIRAVLTPETPATSGSKVVKRSGRYRATITAVVAMAMAMIVHMSTSETPSTLPNTVASMLCFTRVYRPRSAIPNAKLAVVMTPIAASAATARLRVTRPTARPDATPQTPAPTKKFKPTAAQIAAPPKIACDRPWPM